MLTRPRTPKPTVTSASDTRVLATVDSKVILGSNRPSTSPATAHSNCTRLARSRRRGRANRPSRPARCASITARGLCPAGSPPGCHRQLRRIDARDLSQPTSCIVAPPHVIWLYVFAAPHPGKCHPSPDGGKVGGEEPLDEHGCHGRASTTPAPPGTGTALAIIEAAMTTRSVAMLACWPTACSDAPRARATKSWLSTEPASTYTILRGSVAIVFRSAQIRTRCGRTRAVASRRSRGFNVIKVAAIPAAGQPR